MSNGLNCKNKQQRMWTNTTKAEQLGFSPNTGAHEGQAVRKKKQSKKQNQR